MTNSPRPASELGGPGARHQRAKLRVALDNRAELLAEMVTSLARAISAPVDLRCGRCPALTLA